MMTTAFGTLGLLAAAGGEDFEPLITNDATIFGILMIILAFVFWSSKSEIRGFKAFYKVVPMLLMCYFLPSLLTLFGIVNPEKSNLYFVASRYFLPASLVLLTISVDFREILRLGPKALIVFLAGTVGVMIGGPLAILIVGTFAPELVGGSGADAVWRGFTTVAGSWIGGGANQLAMKEIWMSGEFENNSMFTAMIAVDILVAETWMLFLLLGIGHADRIDGWFRADASNVHRLQQKMEKFSQGIARVPTTVDLMKLAAVGFGITALAHLAADTVCPLISDAVAQAGENLQENESNPLAWVKRVNLDSEFFWIVVVASTAAVILSFTPARNLEGAGASKMGTVFIFILVAVIGMKMDLTAVWRHRGLFLVGLIWMMIHVATMVFATWLVRAPYFFLAVGSKANIGGAASAPVVAAAFHPSLAPVGVLLAVLGYVLGTYCAWVCGLMMQAIAAA